MNRVIKKPCCDNCQHYKYHTSFYGTCAKSLYETTTNWFMWCYKHEYRKKRGGLRQ